MRIVLTLADQDPPSGSASRRAEAPVDFVGWLGLITALRGLLKPQTSDDEVLSPGEENAVARTGQQNHSSDDWPHIERED